MKYAFGVDVGGTTVKIGLLTEEGTMVESWEIPTNTADQGEHILGDIAASLKDAINRNELDSDDILGIGIGVPGPVGPDGVVNKCVNLGWGVFNIEDELAALTGFKVKAGNDANVATLGEMWKGGAKGYSNVVMLTLGTGVGGGVIVDGKMVAGYTGAAGEIGHMTVNDTEADACNCGRRGCLEQYASATGIVRTAKKYLQDKPEVETQLNIETVSCKRIFDAAKEGDQLARLIVDETGDILGKAMSTVACVLNPEVFVIGGGVSKAGQILIDAIKAGFDKSAFHATSDTTIASAELGNDAGMYGSAYIALFG